MKISVMKMKSRYFVAARRIQSLYMFLFTLAVLGMLCLANTPLQADPINSLYDVTGTMTITGNNVCTPSPCRETIDFSFLYGYNYNSAFGVYDAYVVPSSISVSSFGALGSSFGYSGQIGNPQPGCDTHAVIGEPADANYMPFLAGGTEIDLDACGNLQTTPVAPSFFVSELYSCGNATCESDFVPPSRMGVNPGIFLPGTVHTNVAAVPEGGTSLEYLAIALVPIGFAILWSRRQSPLVANGWRDGW